MKPTLSIVTPSYNQGRYLDETIRSVLAQREEVHEYFVLDGGSTDGSVDVIRGHAGQIDYWESARDEGQSDAIHRGFSRATGTIVGWLNSDDLLLPGALRAVREAFERDPELDVVTGWHVQIDAGSRLLSLHRIPGESLAMASWGVLHACQQSCFFRRELYERVGGLRLDLHCVMDTELWYRMLRAGSRWGHLPRYQGAFRIHPGSKGQSWLARYEEEERLLDRTYPEFRAPSLKHRAGIAYYRLGQVTTGRQLLAWRDTLRLRGRAVWDVFGA